MGDSAEVRFAQTLASNEKKFRDRALKRLYKYLNVRSTHGEGLSHEDFIKIWKGLHYCMWMQDKPVIQEELSEKIGNLLKAFPNLEDALRFVNVFFITQAREWSGIDRLRLDKFMMLIREILHEALVRMTQDGWPCSACQSLSHYLTVSVMNEENAKLPYGLKTHMADIFLTEMRKVSWAGLNGKKLTILMFPFIYFLVKTKRRDMVKTVFDKTLKPVLESHGVWPWQGKAKRKKKPKKGAFVRAPPQPVQEAEEEGSDENEDDEEEEDDVSDDEVEMQEEDSGDEDDEEEGDDDDDEDMDVDEESNDVPKPKAKRKFDLSKMLRLMQCLSERPNVESRNRGMMYGVVRSYTTRDPSILNPEDTSANSVTDDAKTGSDNNDDDNGEVDDSIIAQLLGEIEGKKNNKKRRRRRGQEEKYYPGEGGEDDGDNSTTNATSTKDKQSKKKRKFDSEKCEEENGEEESSGNQGKRKKQKRDLCGGDGVVKKLKTDVESQKKTKKNKKGDISNGVASSWDESSASVEMTKKQKKKAAKQAARQSSDGSDANTNARPSSPSKPPTRSLKAVSSSAIEMVVYPQKLPKSPTSLTPKVPSPKLASAGKNAKVFHPASSSPPAVSRMMAWESVSALPATTSETESPLLQPLDYRHNRKAPANSKTRSPTQVLINSETKDDGDDETPTTPKGKSGGGVMDSLMKVVTTPTDLIKKCVAMATAAPATDPGVDRQKCAVTPDEFMTPGAHPKKVVFDLRRNTANKFKDYLKTLATDTSPAFEPSKSPSQSILKSPSNSSLDQSSSSDTPRTRRKAKTGSPKSKKSPLSVGKRKSIKSPLVKRLR